MFGLLVTWIFSALGFVAAERLFRPAFRIEGGFGSALVVAALFGILNALIGWVVFGVIGLATLGIGFLLAFVTRVVSNAIVLKITDAVSDRLTIRGFGPAVGGAIVISVVGAVGDFLLR